jgi:hypothetical protein
MYRNASQGQEDFSSVFPTDQATFYVNICGQSAHTECNPANGVCQVTKGGAGYGNGNANPSSGAVFGNYRMSSYHANPFSLCVSVSLLWHPVFYLCARCRDSHVSHFSNLPMLPSSSIISPQLVATRVFNSSIPKAAELRAEAVSHARAF